MHLNRALWIEVGSFVEKRPMVESKRKFRGEVSQLRTGKDQRVVGAAESSTHQLRRIAFPDVTQARIESHRSRGSLDDHTHLVLTKLRFRGVGEYLEDHGRAR